MKKRIIQLSLDTKKKDIMVEYCVHDRIKLRLLNRYLDPGRLVKRVSDFDDLSDWSPLTQSLGEDIWRRLRKEEEQNLSVEYIVFIKDLGREVGRRYILVSGMKRHIVLQA